MFKPCPPAGSGRVNRWTYGATCHARRSGWPVEKAREYLYEHTMHSGDQAEREIERALSRVFVTDATNRPTQKWPPVSSKLLSEALRDGGGMKILKKWSACPDITAQNALQRLFPDNPLIWSAASVRPEILADTKPPKWPSGIRAHKIKGVSESSDLSTSGLTMRCSEPLAAPRSSFR